MATVPADASELLVALLVGEPGSGRSSLGRALSDALILPLLARDQVRRSLDSTARAWAAGPGPDRTAEDAAQ
jgi:predicted kinase